MPIQQITRRNFLQGCSAAIAALAGSRITSLALSSPYAPDAETHEVLVVVFLRGGWDALNVVLPVTGNDRGLYEAARPVLKIPASGSGAALPLNAQFGMHPSLGPLHDLYTGENLALVHAVGLTSDTRSHFDAMQFIELGTPDSKTIGQGWITRHLETVPGLPPTILMPALSAGHSQAVSLLGSREAVTMSSPGNFNIAGHWEYRNAQRQALRNLYNGDDWMSQAGSQALNAIDLMEGLDTGGYTPANGAVYPGGSFGDHLKVIAQMIKLGVGLRAATVDLGGWDTHENQGSGENTYMGGLLSTLAQGLAAFYQDLDGAGDQNHTHRLSLVVISEFGRRLKENASRGTDHGHGSVMLVMGGSVNGGRVFGTWPGLGVDQLYDRADLAVTTDYRRVLSEILSRRMQNPNVTQVFPGLVYAPLNIVRGHDVVISVDDLTNKIYLPTHQR